MEYRHVPVLLNESIEALGIKPGGIYVDGTVGGGGHSAKIAARLAGSGLLIGIDRDKSALSAASEALRGFENVKLIHDNFSNIKNILDNLGLSTINGFLFDLGVSSYQLDEPSRGFSFMRDAPLDMRMDTEAPLSAYDVVNEYGEKELADIIYKYGEERYSRRVASAIARVRRERPVKTTAELAAIVERAIPKRGAPMDKHPATRTFQAIRIEVNEELSLLEKSIKDAVSCLDTNERSCVITFHSLEDRIIKNVFKELENPCTCPRDLPVCVCGKKPSVRIITKKPIIPGADELETNVRARSAKLRVAEKI